MFCSGTFSEKFFPRMRLRIHLIMTYLGTVSLVYGNMNFLSLSNNSDQENDLQNVIEIQTLQ